MSEPKFVTTTATAEAFAPLVQEQFERELRKLYELWSHRLGHFDGPVQLELRITPIN
jgi:hypothetical protein